MGHQRLGEVPKSRKWSAVVAAVAGGGPGDGGSLASPGRELRWRSSFVKSLPNRHCC